MHKKVMKRVIIAINNRLKTCSLRFLLKKLAKIAFKKSSHSLGAGHSLGGLPYNELLLKIIVIIKYIYSLCMMPVIQIEQCTMYN